MHLLRFRGLATTTTLALSILMTGCKTVERELAHDSSANTVPYSYESSYNCPSAEDSSQRSERIEKSKAWSALSGMKLGPTQALQFKNPSDKILRPFVSDGCSMSIDGIPMTKHSDVWAGCCVTHDASYWLGGTERERNEADERFGRCIADRGYEKIGILYKTFVQKFGGPEGNMIFRWGYGWNFRRPYGNLAPEEMAQALTLTSSFENQSDIEVAKAKLSSETRRLVRACDTYDLAMKGFSRDDQLIYRHLNLKLKKDSRADWVKLEYFNRSKSIYLVKLDDCDAPFEVTISKNNPKTLQVRGRCSDLLD